MTRSIGDAAFGYVNVFTAHVNIGFFRGAELADPAGILAGSGKFMRHVKIRPGGPVDVPALTLLIETAYADMLSRLQAESGPRSSRPIRSASISNATSRASIR